MKRFSLVMALLCVSGLFSLCDQQHWQPANLKLPTRWPNSLIQAMLYRNTQTSTGARELHPCQAGFPVRRKSGLERNGEQWSSTRAENYGHHETDERPNQSGFHWGTGSALVAAVVLREITGG